MRHPTHLRLSLPYTVLSGPDTVHLVAGEDFRYTLTGPGLESWFPAFLTSLLRQPLADAINRLAAQHQPIARDWVRQLMGERVLVEAPASSAHAARVRALRVVGTGPLVELLSHSDSDTAQLQVLCQDRLDYDAVLRFNTACLQGANPWLWVTTGPLGRGYVSPVFLPDAGPCLACLLRQFQRLSPAPEIYPALIHHAQHGGTIEPTPFADEAVRMLQQLVLWKRSLLVHATPPPALYRLHVLELETMEISTHRVFSDPHCPACGVGP